MATPAKILVVADDPAIRNLIQRLLLIQNNYQYQIQYAEDGKTALAMFERSR